MPSVLCRRPDALWRRLTDGVLVLAPDGDGEPLAVLGPAAVVWDLIAEPTPVEEVTSALVGAFGVDESVVARDVSAVIEALEANDLLVTQGASP